MKKVLIHTLVLILLVLMITGKIFAQAVEVDPKIPKYKKSTGISGNANSIGSDTMNNLMTLWLEEFKKNLPHGEYSD